MTEQHASDRTIRDLAIARIDAFLQETGMAPWVLGLEAVNCNKVYKKLVAGKNVTLETIDRLEAFMKAERERIRVTQEKSPFAAPRGAAMPCGHRRADGDRGADAEWSRVGGDALENV